MTQTTQTIDLTCSCAVCRKPVAICHPDTVDHFIYEFDGELDYIELLHRACAERAGYAIDAEGHIGLRPEPEAAPVACVCCGRTDFCAEDCAAFNEWLADFELRSAYDASIRARG